MSKTIICEIGWLVRTLYGSDKLILTGIKKIDNNWNDYRNTTQSTPYLM